MNNVKPAALTIAGSDSGGGAGIQADLRTFNCFNVYGCSVITAVTAQNPYEVRRIDVLSPDAVKVQLETVLDAIPVRWAKTGMLANSNIIERVADVAGRNKLHLVVDPVMVSTSGAKLLEDSAVSALQNKLFPLAEWLTPNIPEAELICQSKLETPGDLIDAAADIYRKYKCNVILKSGHAIHSGNAEDVICHQGEIFLLSSPSVEISGNTSHGTGCTLSSAITANLASGKTWQEALVTAKAFVYSSLRNSVSLSSKLKQMYPAGNNCQSQVVLKGI